MFKVLTFVEVTMLLVSCELLFSLQLQILTKSKAQQKGSTIVFCKKKCICSDEEKTNLVPILIMEGALVE